MFPLLAFVHRWLGVAGSLLFVLWFASGIAMMYVRMPELTEAERLAHAAPLASDRVEVSPSEAMAVAALSSPAGVQLGMHGDRPVYRFGGRTPAVVFADAASRLFVTPDDALSTARRFAGVADVELLTAHDIADQWTLQLRQHLPLFRFAVADGRGTEVYVSSQTGEVVLDTSRRERWLAYVGPVAHWLYLPVLRRNGPLWTQVIIWSSAIGCLLCITGLVAGLMRFSPARRYRLRTEARMSPYAGWLRWHHYAGLLFGLVTLTWTFSGLLSMGPFAPLSDGEATRERRAAARGPAVDVALLEAGDIRDALTRAASSVAVREAEWLSFAGQGYWRVTSDASSARLVRSSGRENAIESVPTAAIEAAARSAAPASAPPTLDWLRSYDAYYYDRNGSRHLPVLRAQYQDAAATWLYFDPATGAVAHAVGRRDRLNRWLYHGLHSFDFAWLYAHRPLWDAVLIVLSLGGIAGVATSFVPAWRRVRRLLTRRS